MQRLLVLVALCFVFVGCQSAQQKAAKSFAEALSADTGQRYVLVKLQTEKGNYSVYQNMSTGEFVAYNMDKWNKDTMTSYSQYQAASGDIIRNLNENKEWVDSGYWSPVYVTNTYYTDEYSYSCDCYTSVSHTEQVYVGDEYVDTSHWYYFYTGGGFRFENNSGVSKDLETIAALKEDTAQKYLAYKFKSEFSLSDSRSAELAKLANRYTRLENARELTTKEKDTFALSALGVSMNQIESAMKAKSQGKEEQYNSLLQTAAKVNSTTPEQIGKFFTEVVDI